MSQVKEAIILAGGLGTRLRGEVPDLPKCMAPVNNRPFVNYVIAHLQKQGIEKFIFSLGYKSEAFTGFLSGYLAAKNYQVLIEKEPLGTGGAILYACRHTQEQQVVVVNGDSLFSINLNLVSDFHTTKNAECTLVLKPMNNFDRYGVVELNADHSIALFREKQFYAKGLINGGVYLLNTRSLLTSGLPEKYSFEKDYLQPFYGSKKIYGIVQDEYFIDIGIPEDYRKAQTELINFSC